MNPVSVIIPNNGRNLNTLMQSLITSTRKPIDVSIVDWGMERSYQRNAAIRAAFGKNILVLDSDQSVSPGLIDECDELIRLGYSCVYIPEVIVADSFFGKVRKFEREFYTGTAVDVPRFVRADLCPKFDETLHGPEDADWGNRIPGIRAVSRNVLYHHDDISLSEYIRKKAYYSKSMRRYAEKWPDDKCLSMKYRCWDVFIEKGKWKKLLRHPKLTVGIIFILAVRAWIYATHR
jgi:hypothetical protein